jgi:hypothetical protein
LRDRPDEELVTGNLSGEALDSFCSVGRSARLLYADAKCPVGVCEGRSSSGNDTNILRGEVLEELLATNLLESSVVLRYGFVGGRYKL